MWGDRVYVTTAVNAGPFKAPSTGILQVADVRTGKEIYKARVGGELAKNSVGEMSLATPAADASGLYVRTQTKLYRVQAASQP